MKQQYTFTSWARELQLLLNSDIKRADITVFSPSELSEGEDGRNRGFRLVMVNGKIALKDDRVTEISEGRILRV